MRKIRDLYTKVTIVGLLCWLFDRRYDALRQYLRHGVDLQHPRFRAASLRLGVGFRGHSPNVV